MFDRVDTFKSRRHRGLVWVILLGLLIALSPIAFVPTLPLLDYPGHLARLYLLEHAAQSPLLSEYYQANWQFLPNLAFELISQPIAQHLGIDAAGRVFLGLVLTVQLAGVVALNSALHGRLSVTVLLAFPLLYGRLFTYGFLSFNFGLGLTLCCLAAWIRWRDSSLVVRTAAFSLAGCLLLISHLFAFGLYGLAVTCLETCRAFENRRHSPAIFLGLAGGLAQLVMPTALFLALSPTASGLGLTWASDRFLHVAAWAAPFEFYAPALQLTTVVLLALLVAAAYVQRVARIPPGMLMTVITLAALTSFGPDQAASGSILLPRFAVAAAFMVVAALDISGLAPAVERRLATVLLALFALYMAFIVRTWWSYQPTFQSLHASFESLDRGAKVKMVIEHCGRLQALLEPPLQHAVETAIREREVFVPSMVVEARQQPITYRPKYASFAKRNSNPVAQCGTLLAPGGEGPENRKAALREDLATDFDYLYLVAHGLSDVLPPKGFQLIVDGGRFRLYKRQQVPASNAGSSR